MKDAKKILKKNLDDFFEILNIVVTSASDIPQKFNKNKSKIRLLRNAYLIMMLFIVMFSFASFLIKGENFKATLISINILTFFVFAADYVLHWITYPIRDTSFKSRRKSYLKFPFTLIGILLLLCVLPSFESLKHLGVQNGDFDRIAKVFKTLTLVRLLRLILILKVFSPFKVLINVFIEQKTVLAYVFGFIIVLIIFFALIIYSNETEWLQEKALEQLRLENVTPDTQNYQELYQKALNDNSSGVVTTFFDSLYFATVTLTTIGYGDFSPHADTSKVIVMIISILGIAIFAIPSGVIAGSMLSEMSKIVEQKKHKNKKDTKTENKEQYETRS
ncbi:potassium channel family protein [Mycoplasma sp. Ms02]|uniref:potassium channel family protein n=1 Tax=Mycoplasma sp. Ms02 TaxID=353851 RepID=UPI001C8A9817|nr:potassium channel family protein [Mycoplasma sp. Ms02]QZE12632.1 potassium channel family protein [Mycoplasma sp. Ms02]